MNTLTKLALVALAATLAYGNAFAGSKADIVVMTQNQYLGADLNPIIAAGGDPVAANAALIVALTSLSNNNFQERVTALAESIHDKQPHLVALQEVFAFACFEPPGAVGLCGLFPGAFNDHLDETLDALDGEYYVAATVQNLALPPAGFPFPGVPVFLDPMRPPIFVTVTDRDVILARADVTDAAPVSFNCTRPSLDGCNFNTFAGANLAGFPINIERGFVGVDATVDGIPYRFVNTHLEVQELGGIPETIVYQTAQASELLNAVLDQNVFDPARRHIIAGDFNSSPTDVSAIGQPTPYQQLAMYFTDVWTMRPGNPDGFTCCELNDLSNSPSQHDERIDLVFAGPAPAEVKANVLDAEVSDKTLSGLWPSDHASVSAELSY